MKNRSYLQPTSNRVKNHMTLCLSFIFILGTLASAMAGCASKTTSEISSAKKDGTNLGPAKPNSDNISTTTATPDSSIEFILSLTPQEKEVRAKKVKSLPAYTKAAEAVGKFGFRITTYETAPGARQYPVEDSLTGLGFIGEAAQQIGDHEFKVVFMGPARDRLDTIRLQILGRTNQTSSSTAS